jgi:hypothetical protein
MKTTLDNLKDAFLAYDAACVRSSTLRTQLEDAKVVQNDARLRLAECQATADKGVVAEYKKWKAMLAKKEADGG